MNISTLWTFRSMKASEVHKTNLVVVIMRLKGLHQDGMKLLISKECWYSLEASVCPRQFIVGCFPIHICKLWPIQGLRASKERQTNLVVVFVCLGLTRSYHENVGVWGMLAWIRSLWMPFIVECFWMHICTLWSIQGLKASKEHQTHLVEVLCFELARSHHENVGFWGTLVQIGSLWMT